MAESKSEKPSDRLSTLNRLLGRLQQSTLRADAERQQRLVSNEFDRHKARTSIEHARALLTRLEQETLAIKAHARRQELQADLSRKRELIEELRERMRDFDDVAGLQDDEGASSGDEDILPASGAIRPTPGKALGSIADGAKSPSSEDSGSPGGQDGPLAALPESREHPRCQGEDDGSGDESVHAIVSDVVVSRTIRSRRPGLEPGEHGAAVVTSRSLFSDQPRDAAPMGRIATTEAVLDKQRAEQDLLSESILKMASSLKESSQAFSNSLEEDKNVLGRAGEGLNKNELGLEAASRRMGTLTRMVESEGVLGRFKLYVVVYALMALLILLVFAMPKLRF